MVIVTHVELNERVWLLVHYVILKFLEHDVIEIIMKHVENQSMVT